MKSSIKRPFKDISDYIKGIVTCMREDEHGEAQYVIPIAGEDTKYPPFHMAGAYIADRIADIKKDRNSDKVCVVVSVPFLVSSDAGSALLFSRPDRGLPSGSERSERDGLHSDRRSGRGGGRLRLLPQSLQRVLEARHRSLRGSGFRGGASVRDRVLARVLSHSPLRVERPREFESRGRHRVRSPLRRL